MPVSRMHADETETSVELVRALLADQHPQWAEESITPVAESGTEFALYRIGEDKVARLPRHERSTSVLEKELTWLPRLAPQLPLAVPLPVAVGRPTEVYPLAWAVFRWLEGEPATTARIGSVTDDVTGFIAALQRIDTTGGPAPAAHNVGRGAPLAPRDESMRAGLAKLADEIDVDAVTAAWDDALAAPNWDRESVWLHGDLDARNLLVRNGRIGAVLDFGCLGVGDPACDVAVAWKVLPAEDRARFRSALDVDDATWRRARGWVVSQAVIALAYYTLETNPALVDESRRWLAEAAATPEA